MTLSVYTLFQLQGALSKNLAALLSCRLITGITGSSRKSFPHPTHRLIKVQINETTLLNSLNSPFLIIALTNAGGAVSDIWNFRERGLASAIYATVPFLGPGTYFVHPKKKTLILARVACHETITNTHSFYLRSHWSHSRWLRRTESSFRLALQLLDYVRILSPHSDCRILHRPRNGKSVSTSC